MKFIYSCRTDAGTVRENNQDSLIVKSLKCNDHILLFAAVCDGVGGLSQGERTSRKAVEMLSDWADYELPQIMEQGAEQILPYRFRQMISDINKEIYYSNLRSRIVSATTLTALLLWDKRYIIGHAGDSRVYQINSQVTQLTRDHSWVAKEVAMGRMTLEEAAKDTRQNLILRCIGAEPEVRPDILQGTVRGSSVYILCTDGFWHHVKKEEWAACFSPRVIKQEKDLTENLYHLAEQVKQRGEDDNITAVAIEVF